MTRTKSVKALLCVLLSMTLIIAFMPQTANVYAASAKKVTKITKVTSKASKYTMTAGTSKTFQVKLYPKNLTSSARTTYVSTSKKSVAATYSKKYKKTKYGYTYVSFKVKAVKAGTATVTAKAKSGKKVTWKITVKAAAPKTALTGVTLSKTKGVMVGDVLTATAAPSATSVEYQWYADGVAIDGATANTYTVEKAYIGKKLTVKATGLGKYSGTVTSDATEAVVKGTLTGVKVTLPTTDQTAPYVGDVVTATTTPSGAAESVTYQWYRGTAMIANATSKTYTVTSADLGTKLHVVATVADAEAFSGTPQTSLDTDYVATKLEGNALASYSPANPVVTTPGTPVTVVVKTTAAKPATITSDCTYQWYRGSVADANKIGTGESYTPVAKDLGYALVCVITGTPSATATSSFAGTLTVTTPAVSTAITSCNVTKVDGTDETVGAQYKAVAKSTGFADSAVKVSYQWTRNGVAISGATTDTYTLTTADMGANVQCVATGTGSFSGSKQSTGFTVSSAYGEIGGVAIQKDAKTVTSANVGDVLTAVTDPAAAKDSVTYQWKVGGAAITGATSSTYTVAASDLGKAITVQITLKTGVTEYTAVTSSKDTSAACNIVAKLNGVTLTFKDNATPAVATTNAYLGYTATVAADPAVAVATYAWYLDNSSKPLYAVNTSTQLATASVELSDTKYTTTSGGTTAVAISGHKLLCIATGQTSGYLGATAAVKTDTITDAIKDVAISGTMKVGEVLTATVNTVSSTTTNAVTYQWNRNGVAIDKATASTYTTTAADYGKEISCTVIAKTTQTAVSGTATGKAASGIDATAFTLTAITGANVYTGQKLSVGTSPAAAIDDVTVTWYRFDKTLAEDATTTVPTATTIPTTGVTKVGTGADYTIQAADEGHTVYAVVTTVNGWTITDNVVGLLGSYVKGL